MNNIKITLLAVALLLISCKENISTTSTSTTQAEMNDKQGPKDVSEKIQILNFGTFHFGYTSDENSTEFDEHDADNKRQAHAIAKKLSKFNPTVILVESVPGYNEKLQTEYNSYLANPDMNFEHPTETELLAYEIGRLSKVKRIYGIDHKMSYNYKIGSQIKNHIDSTWHDQYYQNPINYYPDFITDESKLTLEENLIQTNTDQYLDFLIAVNADMLSHVGSETGFEGADEAAKYYQRNLRMYANLNRINLDVNDRVFILMGASHTAFFRDFLSRSPKYEMVNTFDYLK